MCWSAVSREIVACESWSTRPRRSPRHIARPLRVSGVRALIEVPSPNAEVLVKAVNKVDVRYVLCVSDDADDQMVIRRCNMPQHVPSGCKNIWKRVWCFLASVSKKREKGVKAAATMGFVAKPMASEAR